MAACLAPLVAPLARAQSYPVQPVRWIVGSAAGGVTDIVARVVSQRLAERLNQSFIIDNRTGAGGNIATEAAVRSPADGYTLFQANGANSINHTLYRNLSFDFVRDLAPVAGIMRVPGVMTVAKALPVKDVAELIAYAKANPGKLTFGTGGVGSTQHVYGELFKMLAGVDLLTVPFRGGAPALAALIAGQVDIVIGPAAEAVEVAKSGDVRALAVTTTERLAVLPELPPLGDTLPGYEASGWQGVCVPAKTPTAIIQFLAREILAAVNDSRIKERLGQIGGVPLAFGPEEFRNFIAQENEKWAKVVRFANLSVP